MAIIFNMVRDILWVTFRSPSLWMILTIFLFSSLVEIFTTASQLDDDNNTTIESEKGWRSFDSPAKLNLNRRKNANLIAPGAIKKGRETDSSNAKKSAYENSVSLFWDDLNTPPGKYHSGNLPVAAAALGSLFKKFSEVELRANQTEMSYNSLPFISKRIKSVEKQSEDTGEKFSKLLKDYEKALEKMEDAIKRSAEESPQTRAQIFGQLPICCELKSETLQSDEYFNTFVDKRVACRTVPNKSKSSMFTPGTTFSQVLVDNAVQIPHLKWQYFVSPEGVHIEYPANSYNCKTTGIGPRPLFNPKNTSERKLWLLQKSKEDSSRNHKIVFLVQLGNDYTASMVKSIKNIVLLLLRLLDETDKVGIVNNEPEQLWSNYLCDQMVPVTSWARYQIMSYLTHLEYRLKPSVSSSSNEAPSDEDKLDQAGGFQKAIYMACQNFSTDSQFPPSAATIIYLTSGIDTDVFTKKHFKVNCPIFIDTFALRPLNSSEEEKYKTTLQNVASKNIWRVQVFSTSQAEPESFAVKMAVKLNSKKEWWSLSDILSQFFPEENSQSSRSIEFSSPLWNPITKEAVIYAKKYVFHLDRPLGLVAIEIPLAHFTQHITYHVNENVCSSKNYAILIDKTGRVLAHPALGRPDMSQEVLSPIQINQLEVHHGFTSLKRQILGQTRGCSSIQLRHDKSWVTYGWSAVEGFDYIVILVMFGDSGGCSIDKEEIVLKKAAFNPKVDIQHHTLLTNTAFCNSQLQSINKASLYLAPSAFQFPADEITPRHSKVNQALMAYIGDSSGFLQNQNRGLKPVIKEHIAALSSIVNPWKSQLYESDWSKYILRRYGTGAGGTFMLVYPGSFISSGYMPSSTPWFRSAINADGKITFNPPSVDPTSGIPISTVSQVINVYPSEPTQDHRRTVPVAVLAADLNAGFFQKLLEDLLPECRNHSSSPHANIVANGLSSVRCFLIDSAGFIIYHPFLTRSLKTLSNIHVTQLEPLSVIDILQQGHTNQEMPMQKKMCHKVSETSSAQGSLQRQYTLSMDVNGVQKLKHGEQCSRYMIVPVPDTNLYLTVVYDACASATAFCPCSTVDNLCLNCLRMEPSDCECPCECPRDSNFCVRNNIVDLPEDIEPCEFPAEILPMIHQPEDICKDVDMPPCRSSCENLSSTCSEISSPENCIGAWQCDWCTPDDAVNKTSKKPLCETYKNCYGYTINQKQGLKLDNLLSGFGATGVSSDPNSANSDSAVDGDGESTMVPIVGVLSVFLVFLGLVVYCYRHRALSGSNSQPELHLLPLQESPMGSIVPQAGSSRSNSDTEPDHVPVPLHVLIPNRGRRRQGRFLAPPRSPLGSVVGTDSDHGYSTMTPHEDSECGAPLPMIALDPPADHVPPAPTSLATTPLPPHLTNVTNTFPNNQFLVPVTVHATAST